MKTVLHVGCGHDDITKLPAGFQQGWRECRLDISPITEPDVLGTSTDMSAIESGTIDAVYSSHNVEHVYPHQVPLVFAEFHRVLADDGFAVVTCPNIQQVAAYVAQGLLEDPLYQSPAGPITALDILYGHVGSVAAGHEVMAHRTGFTEKTLGQYAVRAGFTATGIFKRQDYFDMWMIATKGEVAAETVHALIAQYTPGPQALAPAKT